ncbi:MAG: hypothetical protein GY754_05740 [bacterium]|nr:hypothetical protein [bacterium]
MKFRRFIIILLPIFFMQCSMYYYFFKDESTFFTPRERQMLASTTQAVGYDYGYDVKVSLDYVFPAAPGDGDISGKGSAMATALATYDGKAVVAFYEKMYTLRAMTLFKMAEYKEDEDWKEFTYIEKYLLPSLEKYVTLLQGQALRKEASYGSIIEKRKKLIEDIVNEELD